VEVNGRPRRTYSPHLARLTRVVTERSTTRSPAARHTAVVVLVVVLVLRRWRLPALLLALDAPVSELVQHYVFSHRSGDPLDVAVDRTGGGARRGGRLVVGVTARVVGRSTVILIN